MGSALHVPLPKGLKAGSKVQVTTSYATTDGCIALQWLEKECVYCRYPIYQAHRCTDRRRERRIHISSANANPSMHALSSPSKVIAILLVSATIFIASRHAVRQDHLRSHGYFHSPRSPLGDSHISAFRWPGAWWQDSRDRRGHIRLPPACTHSILPCRHCIRKCRIPRFQDTVWQDLEQRSVGRARAHRRGVLGI